MGVQQPQSTNWNGYSQKQSIKPSVLLWGKVKTTQQILIHLYGWMTIEKAILVHYLAPSKNLENFPNADQLQIISSTKYFTVWTKNNTIEPTKR